LADFGCELITDLHELHAALISILNLQDTNYLSDIGGVLGLWVGFSMLTVTEFIELFMDLIMLKIRGGKRNPPIAHRSFSFYMGSHPRDKTDFPAVEETDTDQTDTPPPGDDRKRKAHRRMPRKPNKKQVAPSSDYWSDTSAENQSKGSPNLPVSSQSSSADGFNPDDYIPSPQSPSDVPPPSYSEAKARMASGLSGGRLTSRDVLLQLG
jgi:hypothetical protein